MTKATIIGDRNYSNKYGDNVGVYGVLGSAGAGKDTYAQWMQRENCEEDVIHYRIAFSDPLKIIVCTLLDVPLESYDAVKRSDKVFRLSRSMVEIARIRTALFNNLKDLCGDAAERIANDVGVALVRFLDMPLIGTLRHILEQVGTECVRNMLGDRYWINTAVDRIDTIAYEAAYNQDKYYMIQIPDVRFMNEALIADFVILIRRHDSPLLDVEDVRRDHRSTWIGHAIDAARHKGNDAVLIDNFHEHGDFGLVCVLESKREGDDVQFNYVAGY